MPTTHDLLALLEELQTLDRLPRTGFLMRGLAEPESVSEHGWHVVFLVWVLARRIPEVDSMRAVEIALVHDLAELRLGDLPRTAGRYLSAEAKERAERHAIEEILAPSLPHARELWAEYAAGESAEARLVKACDRLQMMVKVAVYESWGAGGLADFWESPENFQDGGFAAVRELFTALRDRRGPAPAARRRAGPEDGGAGR